MKILDFDLEGSHFIIEADISPRQEADDDMECQWLRFDFDNTQVYKETDGAVSPFQITAVAWAGYQLTAVVKNEIWNRSFPADSRILFEFIKKFLKFRADIMHGQLTGFIAGNSSDHIFHFSRRRHCKTGLCDQ